MVTAVARATGSEESAGRVGRPVEPARAEGVITVLAAGASTQLAALTLFAFDNPEEPPGLPRNNRAARFDHPVGCRHRQAGWQGDARPVVRGNIRAGLDSVLEPSFRLPNQPQPVGAFKGR